MNSADPNVTAVNAGGTITITRVGALPVLPGGTTVSTVNVTDGTTTATIRVTNPVNCS